MSWRTTAVLFLILALLGGYLYWDSQQEAVPEPTPTPAAAQPEREPLVNATINQVTRLEITNVADGDTARFTRAETGDWFQTAPTNTQLISPTMDSTVTGLLNLSSERRLAATDLSAYGLEQPIYQIALTIRREDGRFNLITFHIGQPTATGNRLYLQKLGDDRVHIVGKTAVDNLTSLLNDLPIANN